MSQPNTKNFTNNNDYFRETDLETDPNNNDHYHNNYNHNHYYNNNDYNNYSNNR